MIRAASFEAFVDEARAQGFDEVLAREVPRARFCGSEGATFWVAHKH